MNTDTPRTDAVNSDHIGFYSCATVPADFARQLERELNEAKAKIESLEKVCSLAANSGYGKAVTCEIERLQTQRDQWKAMAQELAHHLARSVFYPEAKETISRFNAMNK